LAISVGIEPGPIAITPDGRTGYILNEGSGMVTPITVATNRAGPPIKVGKYPAAIVFSRQ
jgi:YVTN family beta-propeller protein